jgi:hypothetical protein
MPNHKLSATFFGGEVKYTKRYRLAQLLSQLTRHFLLMTATPHNGKEEDFQLFMALLDGDRFEGKFRDGVHTADVSDLMRRMVKENLLKFDATPLFPERVAYTVPYKLSDAEAALYKSVTEYVREEFNRAEALENDKRAGTVGFALTILERRLASARGHLPVVAPTARATGKPPAGAGSLHRGSQVGSVLDAQVPLLDKEDVEDLDEAPDAEMEATEEQVLDQATAARSIGELPGASCGAFEITFTTPFGNPALLSASTVSGCVCGQTSDERRITILPQSADRFPTRLVGYEDRFSPSQTVRPTAGMRILR